MSKILCVLDGLGFSAGSKNNILSLSNLPNFKALLQKYHWYTLDADGESVGQEAGLVGNSEVGHMNIGGLKLVPQLSYQITKSSENQFNLSDKAPDQLFDPKVFLQNKFTKPESSKTVHLVGLFSTGTIHSDLRHWAGAIESAGLAGAEKIVLHPFSDGRDSDRKSLVATWEYFTKTFEARIKPFENKIFLGSLGGRFYGMDRDKNWDRVAQGILPLVNLNNLGEVKELNYLDMFFISTKFINFFKDKYNLEYQNIFPNLEFYRDNEYEKSLILGEAGIQGDWLLDQYSHNAPNIHNVDEEFVEYINKNYNKNIFDENITPIGFIGNEINKNDTVWLLNFRTDRMKQFSQMLCDINKEFELSLYILGMNDYCVDQEVYLNKDLEISRQKSDVGYYPIFKNQPVENPLAKKISEMGKTQLHIAETEKYNHVTYFFNGGQNKKWEGEDWVVIDSNKVASHAEKPEMKAKEITDYIIDNGLGKYDYIIVNYANPDMLGHTGDIEASIKSMEVLDTQLGRLITKIEQEGHEMIITADHGNIEFVGEFQKDGKTLTDTEHNPNHVPFIFVSKTFNPQNLVTNINNFTQNQDHIKDLNQVFLQDYRVSLNSDQWLVEDQIPKAKLPLWIAGLCLINL